MPELPRYPKKWAAFGIIFLSILLPFFFAALFVKNPEDLMTGKARSFIFLGEIVIVIPCLLYGLRKGYDLKSLFRWRFVSGAVLLWAFVTGLGISILSDELERLLSYFITPPDWLTQSIDLFRISSITDFILIVGGVALIAPISEEIIFRGFLQTTLEYREQDATKAILITALAFALLHLNSWWVIEIYLLGVALSYFSWRTQSVFPGIIIHMTLNGFSIFLTNMGMRDHLGWYTIGDHVSPIWLVLGAVASYFGFKKLNHIFPLEERNSQTILEKPIESDTTLHQE